jgi:uncharacterized protein YjbJ (UPF0337 family)
VADKDQFKGAVKETTGQIKAGVGKLIGDEKMQAEGKLQEAEGVIQKKVGDVKSAIKS